MLKHGLHGRKQKHPLFKVWCEMRYRCFNPNKHNYKYYGALGVTVCDRWMSFENFVADMGDRPKGATLDRIDYRGNYEPSNCRWADSKTQANNKTNNRTITANGKSLNLCEMARASGIEPRTLWKRLNSGWSEQRAVTQPVRAHKEYQSSNNRKGI